MNEGGTSASDRTLTASPWQRSRWILLIALLGGAAFAAVHYGLRWYEFRSAASRLQIEQVEARVLSISTDARTSAEQLRVEYQNDGRSKTLRLPMPSNRDVPNSGSTITLYFPTRSPTLVVLDPDQLRPPETTGQRLAILATTSTGFFVCLFALLLWSCVLRVKSSRQGHA